MRQALKERIKALEEELADYRRALERENARFGLVNEPFGPASGGASVYKLTDMPTVILELLEAESLDKKELIKRVTVIEPFNKLEAPGRNIHAQLTNLVRSGKIEKRGERYVRRPD